MMDESGSTTSAISYAVSAIIGTLGAITLNQILLLIAALTGIGTFGVNWYYKHQAQKLNEKLAEYNLKSFKQPE